MLYPIEQYIPQGDSQLISSSLLWEYDLTDFDWDKSKCIVVERVIERGRPEDYRGAINRYGGIENFREIIKAVRHLSPKDIAFVCFFFKLNKEELLCYRRQQLRGERDTPKSETRGGCTLLLLVRLLGGFLARFAPRFNSRTRRGCDTDAYAHAVTARSFNSRTTANVAKSF